MSWFRYFKCMSIFFYYQSRYSIGFKIDICFQLLYTSENVTCVLSSIQNSFLFCLDNRKSVSKTRMKPSEHISHPLIEELKFNCDRGPTGIIFMTVFSFHPTRLRRGQTGSEDQIREWSGKHTFFSQSEDVVLKRHFDR